MSKYSEKSKEYTMAYMREKLDEIKFRVPKGDKEMYRQHAESMGEKLTPFIIRSMQETMERDKAGRGTTDPYPPAEAENLTDNLS